MMVFEMFDLTTATDNGIRFLLLALLLVAVVLLLAGATIAVLTWRIQRKEQQHLEKELT